MSLFRSSTNPVQYGYSVRNRFEYPNMHRSREGKRVSTDESNQGGLCCVDGLLPYLPSTKRLRLPCDGGLIYYANSGATVRQIPTIVHASECTISPSPGLD